MSRDNADIALLGTGLAPLIAATHLLSQGKTVLLLNPDLDFFLEDSELPIDPLFQITSQRLAAGDPDRALKELAPLFPGTVETWPGKEEGFHDLQAPHLRQRGRLWLSSDSPGYPDQFWDWDLLESKFVETSDSGLKPQIWEGMQAAKRFPGYSGGEGGIGGCRGLFLPKSCDVDVIRYRNGLLEFVRERLGPDRLITGANQVEPMPGGVRFHAQGSPGTARLKEGLLVFWTPRLSAWVQAQAKRAEVKPAAPLGLRLWEQWSLVSREALDPSAIGMFRDMAVWAEVEGRPAEPHRLAVLRAGPLLKQIHGDPSYGPSYGSSYNSLASQDSLRAIYELCFGLLRWNQISVTSLKSRAVFEWDSPGKNEVWALSEGDTRVNVVNRVDGPIVDVVRAARSACDRWVA